jgi:hypothetical protein
MVEAETERIGGVAQFMASSKKMAKEVGSEIARKAEKIFQEARVAKRQIVVSVRLDDESVQRVEQLIEAGICQSRSEAVAFLTKVGIAARQDLFSKIDQKIEEIRRIREEIKKEAF